MPRENRLSARLPDSVMIRFYAEHEDEPLDPADEHLRAAIDAARAGRQPADPE